MTAQELKNSILMQAVQGKLVPQDPNDEPASVLLAKIRAEKEQMMKEGKIKKEPISEIYIDPSDNQHYEKVGKTVKCIEDEIPFQIPKGWEWCRLKSIVTKLVDGDHNPPKCIIGTSKYRMLSSRNINFDRLYDIDNCRFLDEDTFNVENQRTQLQIGDILFTSVGTIGRSCIIDEYIPICFQRSVSVLTTLISNRYLKAVLDSPYYQMFFIKHATGTAQKGFYLNQMAKIVIPVPSISEQNRIVDKIKETLPYIKDYELKCERLKKLDDKLPNKLKKSILQYAIEGKLVKQNPNDEPASELIKRIRLEKEKLIQSGKLKKDKNESYIYRGSDNSYYEKLQNGKEICIDDEIPFEIPKGWEWIRINNCADIYTGNSISESVKKSRYTGLTDGLNYIGTKDVNFDNTINYNNGIKIPLGEPKFKKAYKNNTLICVEGGSAGRKVAILSENVCFGNKLATINSWTINPTYIYLLFQSSIVQEFFKNNMTGIIGGVSVNKLKKLLIPVPPLNEQVRIVSTIKQIFEHL